MSHRLKRIHQRGIFRRTPPVGSEVVLVDSGSDSEPASAKRQRPLEPPEDPRLSAQGLGLPAPSPAQSSAIVPPGSPRAPSYSPSGTSSGVSSPGSSSLSDLDQIPPGQYPAIQKEVVRLGQSDAEDAPDQTAGNLPRVIAETRAYLQKNGDIAFLNRYLPATASSKDFLSLILKLGFLPRSIPSFEEEHRLLGHIKLLHLAMKRVRAMRQRLEHFYNVEHVLAQIQKARKILVITGAGISTSLGIPDFRSSKGFYNVLQHLGLSDPQEVFDLGLFSADPLVFYSIAHMILPPEKCNLVLHSFIKLLQDKNKLLRNYTQNIDNLEEHAGIDPDRLIQCHGLFARARCITCGYLVRGHVIFDDIRAKRIPHCPKCNKARLRLRAREDPYVSESHGVMKPDITFFGELLPSRFHDMVRQDIEECDLLISIGTSLKVAPVAEIVDKVPPSVPQVLINKDQIDHCNFDVCFLGYCDDVASYLCNRLGSEWDIDHPDYKALQKKGILETLLLKNINRYDSVYEVSRREGPQLSGPETPVAPDALENGVSSAGPAPELSALPQVSLE